MAFRLFRPIYLKCKACGKMSKTIWGDFCSFSCMLYYDKAIGIILVLFFIALEIYIITNKTLGEEALSSTGFIIVYNLMILFFIYLVILGYHYKSKVLTRRKYTKMQELKKSTKVANSNSSLSNNAKIIDYPEKSKDMIFVKSLNKEVRICCYQTARLKEDLCYCGRAISKELKDAIING